MQGRPFDRESPYWAGKNDSNKAFRNGSRADGEKPYEEFWPYPSH